ncbi:hypothetical protein DFH27DRAFT_227638 [Peziza echinospora]|nr:hypothetical protein DFH27DRAFT_227638 [Peziza echinospora]
MANHGLTPDSTIALIWVFFTLLTFTVLLRFYALHVYSSNGPGRRPSITGVSPGATSGRLIRRIAFTSSTVVTMFVVAIHVLTALHCVGTTLSIRWGEQLAEIYSSARDATPPMTEEALTQYMIDGKPGALKRDIRSVGLALELGYVCVMWCVKFGFLAVWWNVGRRLWEVLDSPASPTPSRLEGTGGKEKVADVDKAMGRVVKISYSLLCITAFLVVVSFLGIVIYQAVVGGMDLGSESERLPTATGGLFWERRWATIVTALGNLSTDFLLIIIAVMLLRALSRAPMEMRGTWLLFGIGLGTIAAAAARLACILADRTPDSAVVPSAGLEVKAVTALEMVFGGAATCVPGLRALVRMRHSRRPPRNTPQLAMHAVLPSTPDLIAEKPRHYRGRSRNDKRHSRRTPSQDREDAERFVRAATGLPSPRESQIIRPTLNADPFGSSAQRGSWDTGSGFAMIPREVAPHETLELVEQSRRPRRSSSAAPPTGAIGTRAMSSAGRNRSRSASRTRSGSIAGRDRTASNASMLASRPGTSAEVPTLPPLVDRER